MAFGHIVRLIALLSPVLGAINLYRIFLPWEKSEREWLPHQDKASAAPARDIIVGLKIQKFEASSFGYESTYDEAEYMIHKSNF